MNATRRGRVALCVAGLTTVFAAGMLTQRAQTGTDWVRCPQGCVAPAVSYGPGTTWESPTPAPTGTVITEDDPRWDCATMGNKVCGEGK